MHWYTTSTRQGKFFPNKVFCHITYFFLFRTSQAAWIKLANVTVITQCRDHTGTYIETQENWGPTNQFQAINISSNECRLCLWPTGPLRRRISLKLTEEFKLTRGGDCQQRESLTVNKAVTGQRPRRDHTKWTKELYQQPTIIIITHMCLPNKCFTNPKPKTTAE